MFYRQAINYNGQDDAIIEACINTIEEKIIYLCLADCYEFGLFGCQDYQKCLYYCHMALEENTSENDYVYLRLAVLGLRINMDETYAFTIFKDYYSKLHNLDIIYINTLRQLTMDLFTLNNKSNKGNKTNKDIKTLSDDITEMIYGPIEIELFHQNAESIIYKKMNHSFSPITDLYQPLSQIKYHLLLILKFLLHLNDPWLLIDCIQLKRLPLNSSSCDFISTYICGKQYLTFGTDGINLVNEIFNCPYKDETICDDDIVNYYAQLLSNQILGRKNRVIDINPMIFTKSTELTFNYILCIVKRCQDLITDSDIVEEILLPLLNTLIVYQIIFDEIIPELIYITVRNRNYATRQTKLFEVFDCLSEYL